MLNNNFVSWCFKKEAIIILLSIETKYIAPTFASKKNNVANTFAYKTKLAWKVEAIYKDQSFPKMHKYKANLG